MIEWLLWAINAVAAVLIVIAAIRVIVERSRAAPLWVRACNAALAIGAGYSLLLPPWWLEWPHVVVMIGCAGTMMHRLQRRAATS